MSRARPRAGHMTPQRVSTGEGRQADSWTDGEARPGGAQHVAGERCQVGRSAEGAGHTAAAGTGLGTMAARAGNGHEYALCRQMVGPRLRRSPVGREMRRGSGVAHRRPRLCDGWSSRRACPLHSARRHHLLLFEFRRAAHSSGASGQPLVPEGPAAATLHCHLCITDPPFALRAKPRREAHLQTAVWRQTPGDVRMVGSCGSCGGSFPRMSRWMRIARIAGLAKPV